MANGTWKIARNRGSAQLPLVIVAVLAVVLVLVGKTQSTLFDRARINVTDWITPMLETARAPVLGFERWMGSLDEIFAVYQENLKLKEENARLRQWQNAAVMLESRISRYQALLHAVPDPAVDSMLARVIGRSSRPFLETLILDAGKTNGVKSGEAVVDARGMIGRIYLTGERSAWVILLTDLNSRVPVSIAPGNVQAILAGDDTQMPLLDALPPTAMVKPGDQVVSSGDGGLLPQGLPVGVVVADGNALRVALFADAASSEDVRILAFRNQPEHLPAAASNLLPAVAAGLPPAAAPAPDVKPPPPPPPPAKSAPEAIGDNGAE